MHNVIHYDHIELPLTVVCLSFALHTDAHDVLLPIHFTSTTRAFPIQAGKMRLLLDFFDINSFYCPF